LRLEKELLMSRFISAVLLAVALVPSAHAGTIIKLGFGTDALPDIELSNGILSTYDDGAGATQGDQNTEVTFLGTLAGTAPYENDRASITLDGVMLSGSATVIGGTALQATTGGTFELFDPSNNLLLSGTLGNGTLSGPITNIATGGFLTTEFGTLTGGSLLPTLTSAGIQLSTFSIALTNVNGGQGLGVDPETEILLPFTADATASIGGQAPEPTGWLVALLGGFALLPWLRRG
jgi:hypothetical protein